MKLTYLTTAMLLTAAATGVQAQDGKALYDANCKKCHGVTGTPPKAIVKKMEKIRTFDAAFVAKVSTDSIVKVLTKGGGSEDMKSFSSKMNAAEMAAVAKYVHELAAKAKG